MLEVFQSFKKETKLDAKLNFEIFEVIAEKGKPYSDGEFIKNCLEVFTRRMFTEKKCVVKQLSLSRFTEVRQRDDFSEISNFF